MKSVWQIVLQLDYLMIGKFFNILYILKQGCKTVIPLISHAQWREVEILLVYPFGRKIPASRVP